MKNNRINLIWGPKEIEDLRDLIQDLTNAIENAPCELSRRGEMTYECRIDAICRVCEWRNETLQMMKLHEAWRPDSSK